MLYRSSQGNFLEQPINSQTLHNRAILECHFTAEMHKNMLHYLQVLFLKDYDLLSSYLLHAFRSQVPNNVGDINVVEIINFQGQAHSK